LIPGLVVDAVVHEPLGAHPSYVQGYYDRDNEAYLAWEGVSQDPAATEAWLQEWVYGVADRQEYARKLGDATLSRLTPSVRPARAVDYGDYR
jgi:glutaconate CoA-transferase subunit A